MVNFDDEILKEDDKLIEEFSKLLEKGVMPDEVNPESDIPTIPLDLVGDYLRTGKKPEYIEKFYNQSLFN